MGFHVLRLFLKLTSRYDIMMTSYLCRGINGGECTANPERAQVQKPRKFRKLVTHAI